MSALKQRPDRRCRTPNKLVTALADARHRQFDPEKWTQYAEALGYQVAVTEYVCHGEHWLYFGMPKKAPAFDDIDLWHWLRPTDKRQAKPNKEALMRYLQRTGRGVATA